MQEKTRDRHDGRPRTLADLLDPPLDLPDPATIPDHRASRELSRWTALLAEQGIFVMRCEHQPPRESLERIKASLERREAGPLDRGGLYLMISEDCEDCLLDWAIAMDEDSEQLELRDLEPATDPSF